VKEELTWKQGIAIKEIKKKGRLFRLNGRLSLLIITKGEFPCRRGAHGIQ